MYKLGETSTSSALPHTLPSHLSQILNSTSYGLSLGVMLKCGVLLPWNVVVFGGALPHLLWQVGGGLSDIP